jgi:hypothetical protein
MKKFKVKLSLHRKPVPDKVEFGRTVHIDMTGNANFTTPSPTLTILKTVTDALEAAYNARQGGAHLAVAQMHLAEEAFDKLMTALGAYVDNVAEGAEDIILSAGMQARKQPSPLGIPVKVVNLKGKASDVLGAIRIRWKSVYGKSSYNVYMKLDGETDEQYKLVGQPTKASITLSDLESAKYYWFRVEAVGTAGVGAVSDAAKVIAL